MECARSDPENPVETAQKLLAGGLARDAAALLGSLIGEGRGGYLVRSLHAKALAKSGDQAGALAAARETAVLHPEIAEAALDLGEALLAAEQLPTAIAEFQRALRLDPGLDRARFGLARAWLKAGEAARALEALAELPDGFDGIAPLLAQAEAMKAQPRSDAGYVRHLFDQFSADYDVRMLSHLAYRAPQILRELAELVMPRRTELAVLDLGCGTGLAGEAFKDRAARLDGVDLSPAMIEQAKARGIYHRLAVADIEGGLGDAAYDLVIAADTLVYLGDLEPVMRVAAAALKADGFFLFTVEAKEGEGFEFGPKRRWRHSEAYLRRLAGNHGFDLAGIMGCVPRREANAPVGGFAVAFSRKSIPIDRRSGP